MPLLLRSRRGSGWVLIGFVFKLHVGVIVELAQRGQVGFVLHLHPTPTICDINTTEITQPNQLWQISTKGTLVNKKGYRVLLWRKLLLLSFSIGNTPQKHLIALSPPSSFLLCYPAYLKIIIKLSCYMMIVQIFNNKTNHI
jgi:hypothetical protein